MSKKDIFIATLAIILAFGTWALLIYETFSRGYGL